MGRVQHHFNLYPVQAGGNKKARIETLQPLAKNGRLWIPRNIWRTDATGQTYDVVAQFIRFEWTQWPKPTHDDMLDALCRVTDGSTTEDRKKYPIPIEFPKLDERPQVSYEQEGHYDPATRRMV